MRKMAQQVQGSPPVLGERSPSSLVHIARIIGGGHHPIKLMNLHKIA